MSTTSHLKVFSITDRPQKPNRDELPKPTRKMRKHPNSNSLRHIMFGRGNVEQGCYCTSATATWIKYLIAYKFIDPTPTRPDSPTWQRRFLPIYCPSPEHLGFNRQTSFFETPIWRVLSDETMNCFTTKWTHEQKQWRLRSFTSCSQDFSISHHSLYR